MDNKRLAGHDGGGAHGAEVAEAPPSRAAALARRGFRTTTDIKRGALAIAEDVLTGALPPKAATSAVSAFSTALRTFDLEMRHCQNAPASGHGIDLLESPQPAPDAAELARHQERQRLLARLAELDAASGKALAENPAPSRKE